MEWCLSVGSVEGYIGLGQGGAATALLCCQRPYVTSHLEAKLYHTKPASPITLPCSISHTTLPLKWSQIVQTYVWHLLYMLWSAVVNSAGGPRWYVVTRAGTFARNIGHLEGHACISIYNTFIARRAWPGITACSRSPCWITITYYIYSRWDWSLPPQNLSITIWRCNCVQCVITAI